MVTMMSSGVTLLICFLHTVVCQLTIEHGTPATQTMANQNCRSLQSNLISVQDAATDQQVITQMASLGLNDAWLGATREDTFPYTWKYAVDQSAAADQGCYLDSATSRDLATEVTSELQAESMAVTPTSCMARCKARNFIYAAVQAGFRCFCDNTYGRYGTTIGCDYQCTGDQTKKCGGDVKNRVYRVDGAFTIWGLNKPNNYTNNYMAYQACVMLNHDMEYKYDDDDCEATNLYICQLPFNVQQCVGDNDGTAEYLGGVCYYFSNKYRTWFVARYNCLQKGGNLVKFSDEVMFNNVKALTSGNTWTVSKYWIGLTDRLWIWPNGAVMTYTNWAPQYPANREYICTKISKVGNTYYWKDANCSDSLPYICKTEVRTTTTTLPTTTTTTTPRPTTTTTAARAPTSTSKPLTAGPTASTTTTVAPVTPAAAAATGDGGISTLETVLIILIVILLAIVIGVIIVMCIWKRADTNNQVSDSRTDVYDGRDLATVPGPVKIDAESYYNYSDYGSQADLIPPKNARARPDYDRREYIRP